MSIEFDNKFVMDFNDAIICIKHFFENHFPSLSLLKEYNESGGYWGIKYGNELIIISFASDRGGLDVTIVENTKEYSLLEVEPKMKNVEVASEKNILFSLSTIKRFLEGMGI